MTVYQQINLYQPVLADTQQKLSATTLAAAAGILLTVLAGLTVQRPSLEDVYLELIGAEALEVEAVSR